MDKIILQGCQFYGYHGVFSEEQQLGQLFVVDCELTVDLMAASQSDDLSDTINYGAVFEVIKYHVEIQQYRLLEKLAGELCRDLYQQYEEIQHIRLKIIKKNPPIAGHYQAVGIEIERERQQCIAFI